MTRKEAVDIIKGVLDATVQRGLYATVADVVRVNEALGVVQFMQEKQDAEIQEKKDKVKL